jgi:hypothetical protein
MALNFLTKHNGLFGPNFNEVTCEKFDAPAKTKQREIFLTIFASSITILENLAMQEEMEVEYSAETRPGKLVFDGC